MKNLFKQRIELYNWLLRYSVKTEVNRNDVVFITHHPVQFFVCNGISITTDLFGLTTCRVNKDLLLSDLIRSKFDPDLTFRYDRTDKVYYIDNSNLNPF